MADELLEAFEREYGSAPSQVVRSPGRVNLIGEHTDYSGGFVLPIALQLSVRLAYRPRTDKRLRLRSRQFDTPFECHLGSTESLPQGWGAYPMAVARILAERGFELWGLDGWLDSDLPKGAGLSSSAALELAVARALTACALKPWQPREAAIDCQRAESEHVGVQCGPMDQLICALGQTGHALLLDCRSLTYRQVPVPERVRTVVLDTGTRRNLVDSAYNERRRELSYATSQLGVASLRDATLDDLAKANLEPVLTRRVRHVLTENERTLAAAQALSDGAPQQLGHLMNQSHLSLRDDFEVSAAALDALTDISRTTEGCHGARMTGAGFAGCGVAIVAEDAVEHFVREVAEKYRRATGREARFYPTAPAAGVSIEPAQPQTLAVSQTPAAAAPGPRGLS